MKEHEIKQLSNQQLVEFVDEQKKLGSKGLTITKIAEILGYHRSTLHDKLKKTREREEIMSDYKHTEEQTSTPKETNVKKSEVKNADFTPDEIKVLKELISERESDLQLFHEYRIYKELDKVPTDAETVRSAFNMSKTTTERLKKYASERRLPLQDLVELAVINLLDQYDKK